MTRRRARPRSSAEAVRALVVKLLDEKHALRMEGYRPVGRARLRLGKNDVLSLSVTMRKVDGEVVSTQVLKCLMNTGSSLGG